MLCYLNSRPMQAVNARNRVLQLSITGLLAFTSLAAEAQDRGDIYKSAAFLGRGHTGVAIADDEDAIFYNPAGVASGDGIYKKTVLLSPMIELSNSTKDLIREFAVEKNGSAKTLRKYIGTPQNAGIQNFTGIVLRRAALGAVVSANNDILIYKNPDAGALESAKMHSRAYGGGVFTLADSFLNKSLLIGVTGKYLYKAQVDIDADLSRYDELQNQTQDLTKTGTGGGLDVGFMYKINHQLKPSIGLQIQDLGDTTFTSQEAGKNPDSNMQIVNFGFAIETGTKLSKLRLLADYRDLLSRSETDAFKKIHLGADMSVIGIFGFSCGLNQGYPTAGLYADARVLRLDFGFYSQEMGEYAGHRGDRRLYLRLSAGF